MKFFSNESKNMIEMKELMDWDTYMESETPIVL